MHIEPVAEEVVYEVVAEPHVPLEQAQQEVRESPVQGLVEPSVEQQPKGKPQCITYYFKL